MTSAEATCNAYCPHCGLSVERTAQPWWPEQPTRCPHCELLIGVGRCRSGPADESGAKGAAAGVLSRNARRADDGDDVAEAPVVLDGIRRVARELGTRTERLLMFDYQQRAEVDPGVPPLRDVFFHFASWKQARQVAAED